MLGHRTLWSQKIQKSRKQNLVTKEARNLGPKHQNFLTIHCLTKKTSNKHVLPFFTVNPQNLAQCLDQIILAKSKSKCIWWIVYRRNLAWNSAPFFKTLNRCRSFEKQTNIKQKRKTFQNKRITSKQPFVNLSKVANSSSMFHLCPQGILIVGN